ncbi:DinB family protein [Fredinandcohnia quinoae]|uniref:DinB family protein n=1 Tax=Fredinandcohnia quinoae TaxID=2918902 RepID=A0AAW5E6L8_9BACI|nr:DinB family protein [Fredinandcohnia sp. SECRCQ15]MCH1624414.1 DinB family protein [Fredinandcohnia sp. SECRCQ15]
MSNLELIETYKSELQNYSLEQLRSITAEGVWSIGQMYDHVILVAMEYLDHVETCATLKVEQELGKTDFGEQLFKIGGFPPIKIRLPDELNTPPSNSDSKEDLTSRLDQVMKRLRQWESRVDAINPNYKVKHDGFGWLNASEWFDLVGMHFRHHLRQKYELEHKIGFRE